MKPMKLWIARDEKSNYCVLFLTKPHKVYDKFNRTYHWRTEDMMGTYLCLPSSEFTDVTYENSPRQVELNYVMNGL